MPNRIIKESAFSSERIAGLTDFEFRLWVGLITQADDLGRGDARPAIIRGRVFPLRERVTLKDIDGALRALATDGCIDLYTVDGRAYYLFPGWSEHQRIRNVRPKYPGPEEADEPADDLPQPAAERGEPRPESNPNPNTNPNPNPNPKPNPKPAPEGGRSPLEAALDDFAACRSAMKKPLTARARELTRQDLEKLAPGDEAAQIAILNRSIQRGWQGVFPLDARRDKGSGNVFFDLAKEEGLL